MGHASISITDTIYTHLFNGDHTNDMNKLDAFARQPSAPRVAGRIG
jgi:integrase